ncbi:hypothetical protein [Desulfonatronovibrio hydrogenovorans]|uniref:hypothetical protein n=1 Tax=Desulfonatronovibrio hydrogenovorans TaxID=53245 RepID=UPI0012947B80|nr:hypothetical protein [Desulfonatronovibrio hydrogenovorans]
MTEDGQSVPAKKVKVLLIDYEERFRGASFRILQTWREGLINTMMTTDREHKP